MSAMPVLGTSAPPATREDGAPDGAGVPQNAVLRAAMRVGLAISLVTFLASSSLILLDQWISGQVPASFILGTALVLLGFSVGIFGTILGIGLIISVFSGATGILEEKSSRSGPQDHHLMAS
jgi:hypothetical protein